MTGQRGGNAIRPAKQSDKEGKNAFGYAPGHLREAVI